MAHRRARRRPPWRGPGGCHAGRAPAILHGERGVPHLDGVVITTVRPAGRSGAIGSERSVRYGGDLRSAVRSQQIDTAVGPPPHRSIVTSTPAPASSDRPSRRARGAPRWALLDVDQVIADLDVDPAVGLSERRGRAAAGRSTGPTSWPSRRPVPSGRSSSTSSAAASWPSWPPPPCWPAPSATSRTRSSSPSSCCSTPSSATCRRPRPRRRWPRSSACW